MGPLMNKGNKNYVNHVLQSSVSLHTVIPQTFIKYFSVHANTIFIQWDVTLDKVGRGPYCLGINIWVL